MTDGHDLVHNRIQYACLITCKLYNIICNRYATMQLYSWSHLTQLLDTLNKESKDKITYYFFILFLISCFTAKVSVQKQH